MLLTYINCVQGIARVVNCKKNQIYHISPSHHSFLVDIYFCSKYSNVRGRVEYDDYDKFIFHTL